MGTRHFACVKGGSNCVCADVLHSASKVNVSNGQRYRCAGTNLGAGYVRMDTHACRMGEMFHAINRKRMQEGSADVSMNEPRNQRPTQNDTFERTPRQSKRLLLYVTTSADIGEGKHGLPFPAHGFEATSQRERSGEKE